MAQKVLAITIGNDWIKIAEESFSQKGIQVFHASTIATPEGAVDDGNILNIGLVAGAIEAELVKNQIGCRNVIFSMQSSKIANKEVMTPALRDTKLYPFIMTNATEYFPVNIDDYILTYSVLETIETEENGKQHRVMVVAAPSSMVQGYYDLAKACGLFVTSLDYVGNSNLQLTRLQIDEKTSLILQMGEDSTVVSILSNNMLRLMRTVPYGKSTVVSALMEKKESENFSYDDAYRLMTETVVIQSSFASNEYVTDSLRYLVNNVARVMDYYISKNPDEAIEKVYILSEGEGIKGLDDLLHNELNGVEVNTIERLVDVDLSDSNINESNVTLYLSNIGAVVAPVNFVPADALQAAKSANKSKYMRLALLVSVLIAVVLIAIPFRKYLTNKETIQDYKSKINSLEYVKESVADYYMVKDEYNDLSAFKILAQNADDDMGELITFLEKQMPSDISVKSMSISSGIVSMSITCNSKNTIAEFLHVLKMNPSITQVNTPSISESKDAYGVITDSCTISFVFLKVAETPVEENTEGGAN